MKKNVLGLDLGPNSIGWAIIEHEEKEPVSLEATGVRIFQEAVEAKTKTPKNHARRDARSARKRNKRRRMRKDTLLNALIYEGFLPEDYTPLMTDLEQYNPYLLRAKGSEEELTPYEFGRILFHLNQRRGFQSNRKLQDDKEDGVVKSGISELRKAIKEGGYNTLGEYLFNQPKKRGIYTDREMYKEEYDFLWEKQKQFHPEIFTLERKIKFHKIIFFQRPLKSQKHLIGNCVFEKNKKRCVKAHLEFQKFRYMQTVNNLLIMDRLSTNGKELTLEQKKNLYIKLEKQQTMSWISVRRTLKLMDGQQFNLEIGGLDKLQGNTSAYKLRTAIPDKWDKFSWEEQKQLFTDVDTIHHEAGFVRRMREHWEFTDVEIEKLGKIGFEQGYNSLSYKALCKILPHLEEGLTYDKACEAAGYDHSNPDGKPEVYELLPAPPSFPNPIVQKALWETRRVVNAIIKEFGKPDVICIEMARDMKKSKKQRQDDQKKQTEFKKKNEKAREILQTEFGILQPSRDDLIKYRLWEECGHTCPYTGKKISRQMLYSPEVDVEHILPYSISLNDSYMNKTLCLARENREVKRNRTPWQTYFHDQDRWQTMMQRLEKMENMPDKKKKLFKQEEVNLDEFIERQLNDTRYIATEVKKFVAQLGVDVQVSYGNATATLRKKWDLNTILAPPGETEKNRMDHRHHAVDAVVIALTSRSLFKKLADISKQMPYSESLSEGRFKVDPPWYGFRDDVQESINGIIVSHAQVRKLTGALHEESALGLASMEENGKKATMVKRVRIEELSPGQLEQIRDERTRQHLKNIILTEHGIITAKTIKDSLAKPVFSDEGQTVPIRTVRLLLPMKTSTLFGVQDKEGKKYKFYRYGNYHHVEILENNDTGKRKGIFITTLEAASRARRKDIPIVQKDHGSEWKFIMSLAINDMVILHEDDKRIICRVQKMEATNNSVIFRDHLSSYTDDKTKAFKKSVNILRCTKISVDAIGNVSNNND